MQSKFKNEKISVSVKTLIFSNRVQDIHLCLKMKVEFPTVGNMRISKDFYMDHHGLRWGRETYKITCPQNNSLTFWCLNTMISGTKPHEEHQKYVLQVVQLQPIPYQVLYIAQ